MHIIKILKRRDASSVVVAVVLAIILAGVLPVVTSDLATYLAGIETAQATEWRGNVVRPLISAALQIIVFEAFLRLVVLVRPYFVRKKR